MRVRCRRPRICPPGCGRPTAAVGRRSAARRIDHAQCPRAPGHDIRGDARPPARRPVPDSRTSHEVPLGDHCAMLVIILLSAIADTISTPARQPFASPNVVAAISAPSPVRTTRDSIERRPPVRRVRRYPPHPCRYPRTSSPCRISVRRRSACTRVAERIAPVAPSGWPSAIAPPIGLTFVRSSPRSLITAACAANAS